jgi:hypothetical protein
LTRLVVVVLAPVVAAVAIAIAGAVPSLVAYAAHAAARSRCR